MSVEITKELLEELRDRAKRGFDSGTDFWNVLFVGDATLAEVIQALAEELLVARGAVEHLSDTAGEACRMNDEWSNYERCYHCDIAVGVGSKRDYTPCCEECAACLSLWAYREARAALNLSPKEQP